MSTLTGNASKGEKGKPKFQSLDINNLYRVSRGESLETHQQKNALPRKIGMQSLGKLPSARRAPANLPSLKSEHSGNDPAATAVPPSTSQPSQAAATLSPATQAAASAVAANATIPTVPTPIHSHLSSGSNTGDKLWSSIMVGGGGGSDPANMAAPSFLAHQSPLFQQEFPSLSSGDGQGPAVGQKGGSGAPGTAESQYGPGPSLRPQSGDLGGARSNLGPLGPQGVAMGQGGQPNGPGPNPMVGPGGPATYRGVMPTFMFRAGFSGPFPPNMQGLRPRFPYPTDGRFSAPRLQQSELDRGRDRGRDREREECDELRMRPIIKEEDLNRMDDLGRDAGWAVHDDIDYNQKLTFSDDESPPADDKKKSEKDTRESRDQRGGREDRDRDRPVERDRDRDRDREGDKLDRDDHLRSRVVEDEEAWSEQRRKQNEQMAVIVERAKLRKEEEEKRFEERQLKAKKKLLEMDAKLKKDSDEPTSPGGPSAGSTEARDSEDKPSDFHQLTKIERPVFVRDRERDRDRDRERERDRDMRAERHVDPTVAAGTGSGTGAGAGPQFSRQFQSNLPPRFQKQQAERHAPSSQPAPAAPNQAFEQRWAIPTTNNAPVYQPSKSGQGRRNRTEAESASDRERERDREPLDDRPPSRDPRDRDRRDRHTPDTDRYRPARDRDYRSHPDNAGRKGYYDGPEYGRYGRGDYRGPDYDRKDRDEWERDRDRHFDDRRGDIKKDYKPHGSDDFEDRDHDLNRQDSGEWRDSKDRDKPDRRDRRDSRERDLRDVRDPRDPRDMRQRDYRDRDIRDVRDGRDSRDVRDRDRGRDERERDRERDRERERDGRGGPAYRRDFRGPRDDLQEYREDRPERPQRPDSRDSRTSRNSREDVKMDGLPAWADVDPHYESSKDKKHRDFYRDRRDGPGNEKSDRKAQEPEQTWRSPPTKVSETAVADQVAPMDQSLSSEKDGSAVEKLKTAVGESLKDVDRITDLLDKKLDLNDPHNELRAEDDKSREDEKAEESKNKGGRGRGGRGGRPGEQQRGNSGTGGGGGGGGSSRRSGRYGRRRGRGGDYQGSESEASGDEISVSTESGKEDVRAAEGGKRDRRGPRSPKSGRRKDDKDKGKGKDSDKDPHDRRQDYDHSGSSRGAPKDSASRDGGKEHSKDPSRDSGREGFAPRGEPSRRGRGGSLSTRGALGRRMDGYGPPPSKSPFGQSSQPEKGCDGLEGVSLDSVGDVDTMDKKSQPSMGAGVIGSGLRSSGPPGMTTGPGKPSSAPPGSQGPPRSGNRKGDGERKDSRRRDGRQTVRMNKQNSVEGGEEWDSVSEGSEGDDRQDVRNGMGRRGGGPRQQPGGSVQSGRSGSGRRGGKEGQGGRGEKRQGQGEREKRGGGGGSGAPQTNGRSGGGRAGQPGGKMQQQSTVAVNRIDEVKLNDPSLVSQAISDLSKKEKEKANSLEGIDLNNFANNGFQEVRNKKTTKDTKKEEPSSKAGRAKSQPQGQSVLQSGGQTSSQPQSGQQASQQPQSLMSVNTQPSAKQNFERTRPCKLPPRLAKQRENNRLQKQQAAAAQQQDVNEMNKMNQNISMYPMKDQSGPAPPPPVNAWDKPINASLRPSSPASSLASGLQLSASIADNCNMDVNDHGAGSGGSSQRSSPAVEKLSREIRETRDVRESRDPGTSVVSKDAVLDGASPPVQTIIFENTNYKQGPTATNKFPGHHKGGRLEKSREMEETHQHPHPANLGFDMKTDSMDGVDMKLDFACEFSDLSQLTDDKAGKSMGLPRSMHSTLPSTADLNFKIAAVKKVWETMPTGMEQGHGDETQAYAPSFNSEGVLDATAFSKAVESPQLQMDESSEVVYSPGPQMQPNPNSYSVSAVPGNSASPNVCKVKPQPSMPPGPQLSPPPFNSQPASHIANYQPTMSSTAAQFGGISAIPSPPTVLYNSSQGSLYQTFLSEAQVLGGQQLGGQPLGGQPLGGQPLGGQPLGGQPLGGQPLSGQPLGGQPLGGQPRSQFTQFAPYQLSQGLNQTSAFNQQSVYVHQTAPPHPPPSAGPDLYQPMSQYRIQPAAGPFGQSQQMSSNPNTVLISSTSNSLMSASVKPSSHSGQIGAIGTKGGAPSPFQTSAPQASQLFIPYDPNVLSVNQNYLSNSQLVQRAAPVQNMQPSSSFYSTSAGAQAGFYQAGSSLQAAPAAPQLHQTAGPFGLQNFSSHAPFLSSNLQMAAAAAVQQQQQQQQQQYRNSQPSYLKGALGGQPPPSPPPSQQPDMLASVFSSGSQIPSPKSRDSKKSQSGQQGGGQGAPNHHSPTPQHQGDSRSGPGGPSGQSGQGHKFPSYQSISQPSHMLQQNVRGNQMNVGSRSNMGQGQSGQSRYPAPIQRPNSYNQSGMSSGNMNMNRHRTPTHNSSRPPPSIGKQGYYSSSQGAPVKLEGAGNTDNKTESSPAELKDTAPLTSGSTESSTPAESPKEEAPTSSAD